jgi:sulfopyruvate decarboxylase TPP-binding subunit
MAQLGGEMVDTATSETGIDETGIDRQDRLRGSAIIAAVKASGVGIVVSVPDITTSEGLLRPLANDTSMQLVRICKEDEGVAICLGLAYCGKRALLLIQNTGFLDSINALRGIAVEYGEPICLMIGLLARDRDKAPSESRRLGIRIVEPILDAMGIDHHLIENDADVALIQPAIEAGYARSRPLALLIGQIPEAA